MNIVEAGINLTSRIPQNQAVYVAFDDAGVRCRPRRNRQLARFVIADQLHRELTDNPQGPGSTELTRHGRVLPAGIHPRSGSGAQFGAQRDAVHLASDGAG